jgi:tetratricopeptide (TPR) repeat protein
VRFAIIASLVLSLTVHAQSAEVKKYLNAAVTLYENLEYEKALKQIQRAKTKSTGAGDDARIALYEGIIYADMGKEEQALNTFKTGLSMEPEAKLPLEVSPKVEKVFNKARDNVQKLLGPQLEKQREEERQKAEAKLAEEKKKAEEDQKKKDEEAARLAAIKPAEPDRPPPAVVVQSSPGPSVRTLGFIPLGVGVASAGVSVFLLISAKGKYDSLNNGTVPLAEAPGARDSGKTFATMGYVFSGVAAAGIAAAAVMFAVGGESSTKVSFIAGPDQAFVGVSGTLP